jgi:hypothetical protein
MCDACFSKFHKNKKKSREDKAHDHKMKKLARFEAKSVDAAAVDGDDSSAPASGASGGGVGAGAKGRGDGLGKNKVRRDV